VNGVDEDGSDTALTGVAGERVELARRRETEKEDLVEGIWVRLRILWTARPHAACGVDARVIIRSVMW
jgi:hypothetical protein